MRPLDEIVITLQRLCMNGPSPLHGPDIPRHVAPHPPIQLLDERSDCVRSGPVEPILILAEVAREQRFLDVTRHAVEGEDGREQLVVSPLGPGGGAEGGGDEDEALHEVGVEDGQLGQEVGATCHAQTHHTRQPEDGGGERGAGMRTRTLAVRTLPSSLCHKERGWVWNLRCDVFVLV